MLDPVTVFRKYESLRSRLPSFTSPATTIEINSILEIAREVDVFVFDAFGVLNIGEALIPGADLAIKELRKLNKKVRVLTNAASYDKVGSEKKFFDLGLSFQTNEIITSRDAALENITSGLWGVITAEADNLNDLEAEYILLTDIEEDFDKVIEVNLKSVFNMTKACQRVFLKNRRGSIINMSSVVGVKGNAGQSNYAASKSGIIGFSKSIAQELGSRNIRCNVIAPGFIKTEMTDNLSESIIEGWKENIPLKRPGESVDVANLCLFLASDLSSYITGQVINVDGGLLT